MPFILVIDKTQSIKEVSLKQINEDDLYKKAGFKSSDNFKAHATWNIEVKGNEYSITVYGKTEGRANQENKYDFPPPIDNTLFFGSCVLVNRKNGEAVDLKESDWTNIYDHLFGGFEDIGSKDSDDEEDESIEGPVTKEGYSKDGFVVDDDDDSDYNDESEEEIVVVKKKKTANKKTVSIPKPNKKEKKTVVVEPDPKQSQNEYLDCSSELSEEGYF
jgi:hypothetical protein